MSTYYRRSRFVYGPSDTEFITELSAHPWTPVDFTVGGARTSAAGVPASYVVRRDNLYELPLRITEDEWQQFLALVAFGQTDEPFTWYPDADDVVAIPVYLENPLSGERWAPSRMSDFLRVFEITLVLRQANTTTWQPYFEDQAEDLVGGGGGGEDSDDEEPGDSEEPDAEFTHEPEGFNPLVDHDFVSVASGWANATGHWCTVTDDTDATAPVSPSDVAKWTYPAGASSGPFPSRVWNFADQFELYICCWIKVSSPWDWHTSAVNKLFYVGTNSDPLHNNELVCVLYGTSVGTAQIRFIVQDPGGMSQGWKTPNVFNPGFSLGVWHKLEVRLKGNTGGLFNGEIEWWIDNVHSGNHADSQFKTSGTGKFTNMLWQHYWGGGADNKSQTDAIWDDHLYISGAP